MASNTKLHKRLKKAKQATVSLDSLLGLLSSAYGTEEIDSAVVFKENKIDWQNLSVENFKSAPKKQVTEEEKKLKPKVIIDKNSVATSTTSLKPSKSEGEVDITLVSIKSLESFNQVANKSEEGNCETNSTLEKEAKQELREKTDPEEITVSNTRPTDKEQKVDEMVDQKATGDCLENQKVEVSQQKVIFGFYVDDANKKVVFDIQFMKKVEQIELMPLFSSEEPEICLSVVDISKPTKALIKVDKNCLISKSQYFTEVDKELGLENLNVAVKCNLSVFHWIIQWLKADIPMCKPNLNDSNLKSVLLIAHHLKVDQLVEECLYYFHNNCKTVMETDWEIVDVLDDSLILQLVVKFTIAEIDAINDFFDSFKERLYCSLIRHLSEPEPSLEVDHYSSLATLFKCQYCEKLFHFDMRGSIFCRSDCNKLNFKGDLLPSHVQLPSWNLSKYVELMHNELGIWKIVYWRLWGKCHFLKCKECKIPFPLEQYDWCSYHPQDVEYFSINSHELYPVGTYKCCGEVAYRFNVLKQYGGCKFKSHSPELCSEKEIKIYKAFQSYKHFICCQPPENKSQKKFVKLVKKAEAESVKSKIDVEHLWWNGIRLAPKEKKEYAIVPQAVLDKLRNRPEEKKPEPKYNPITYNPSVPMGIMPLISSSMTVSGNVADLGECANGLPPMKSKKSKQKGALKKMKNYNLSSPGRIRHTKKKKLSCGYQPTDSFWVTSETTKDNQDNQRDFEEIAMRSLVKMLIPEDCLSFNPEPAAGSYIRLEAEWWREHNGGSKVAGTSKNLGTVVNRTYPLSWFRKLSI